MLFRSQSIEEPVTQVVQTVKDALDSTPPELASDIMDEGIVLAGGGALISGLEERIRNETGMPVHLAKDPLLCVAMGSGKCLEEFDIMKKVLISSAGQ